MAVVQGKQNQNWIYFLTCKKTILSLQGEKKKAYNHCVTQNRSAGIVNTFWLQLRNSKFLHPTGQAFSISTDFSGNRYESGGLPAPIEAA